MDLRLQLLFLGILVQGVICVVNAVTVLLFAGDRREPLVRTLAGAWVALAVFYVSHVAMAVETTWDLSTISVGIVSSTAYFAFAIMLWSGSRVLATGQPITGRRFTWLLLLALGLSIALTVVHVQLPDATPQRFFARVGFRSLLVGGAVMWGVALLWRLPTSRLRRSPRVFGAALGVWGLTQLYYGITSLLGSLGYPSDIFVVRAYLPLLGVAALATAGQAVVGWMVEYERQQGELQVTRGRLLFEQAAAPMAFVSLDLRWLEVNEALSRFLGYPPEEILGRSTLDITHPDDVEPTRSMADAYLRGEGGAPLVKRYIRPSGEVVWARLVPAVIRNEEGRPKHFLTVLEDETDRRRAAEDLRQAERRNRVLIERSSDLVTVVSPTGTVRFISPAVERLLGYEVNQRVGHPITDILHPDDQTRVLEMFDRVAAAPQGAVELVHYRGRHADGNWRQLESAVANFVEDPTVQGLVVNTRDITDRVQLEDEFRQFQKLEGVGRLAGGIAHDFNNLLTVILGNASLVEQELPAESELRQDVTVIREAAERGADLTRQLLSFARRRVVEPEVIDAGAFVQALTGLLTRLLGPTIELTVDLAPDTGVLVDPGQLQQVMVNLVVNAREAMPDGGRLAIRSRSRFVGTEEAARAGLAAPRDYVVFDVEDSGPGLSPEVREFLFEPFFTTKGSEKGTGLGLATCYGIARQAGGAIVAAEESAGGARFLVYLPRVQGPGAAAVSPAALDTSSGTETVLVVDDEPAVRGVIVRTLRRKGYQILEAGDGVEAEAISAAHDAPIHALVTDVVMPRMGGIELATRLRAARPGLHVLFMSGFAEGYAFRNQAALSGARFLEKPYLPHELTQRLRELLDRQPPWVLDPEDPTAGASAEGG